MLDKVLGFLDVWTLCTARLVCSRFCAAASNFITSIYLSATSILHEPGTNFNSFPNLARLSVSIHRKNAFQVLARPAVRDAVTHLKLVQKQVPFPPLPPLPNLISLTVCDSGVERGFCQGLLFPATLQELVLDSPVARSIALDQLHSPSPY